MTVTKKDLNNQKLYEEAKVIFEDVELFSSKKSVIGLYKLFKKAFSDETLDSNSISIFTFYHILSYLDKQYADVVYYRYIANLTLTECGKILNCSRETIRTREAKAIQLVYEHSKDIFSSTKKERITREVLFKECIKTNSPSDKDILIKDLGFSARTYAILINANIRTASQLCLLTNNELTNIKSITPKAMREINIAKSKLLKDI